MAAKPGPKNSMVVVPNAFRERCWKRFPRFNSFMLGLGLSRGIASRLYNRENKVVKMRKSEFRRTAKMLELAERYSAESCIKHLLSHKAQARMFFPKIRSLAAFVSANDWTASDKRMQVFQFSEHLGPFVDAVSALNRFHNWLVELHERCPELDPVLFKDTGFLERKTRKQGKTDIPIPEKFLTI